LMRKGKGGNLNSFICFLRIVKERRSASPGTRRGVLLIYVASTASLCNRILSILRVTYLVKNIIVML
jgi:hypothetical protein